MSLGKTATALVPEAVPPEGSKSHVNRRAAYCPRSNPIQEPTTKGIVITYSRGHYI